MQTHLSKESVASRLILLRKLTGLSRRSLARKYGISENTLKNWEYANQSGLSKKGAQIMINAFQCENVDCSVSWLLYNKGSAPKLRNNKTELAHNCKEDPANSHQTVQAEIADFKNHHAEAVVYEVVDDSMLPHYRQGDHVAGIRHYAHHIQQLIGKDCVIETLHHEVLLRTLNISTIPSRYNLYAANAQTQIERPFLYDIEIIAAAPVVWIRRGKKW